MMTVVDVAINRAMNRTRAVLVVGLVLASSACAARQVKLEDTIDANKCITNRLGYAKVKFGVQGNVGFTESSLGGDIDGDGKVDELLRLSGGPTTVFATNHGCLRDTGDVQGKIVSLVEPEDGNKEQRGLLTFRASQGCGGLSGQLVLWKPVDRVLAPVSTTACGCPDLTRPNPDRHPLCPALQLR